jgi:NAD-dependent deacetylase
MIPAALIKHLRDAHCIVALTGAGVSAESGVPTFRGAQTGLWVRYRPEELATLEAFLRNPKLVWDWYNWRKKLVTEVQPNPGHYALAEIENRLILPKTPYDQALSSEQQSGFREGSLLKAFTLITQNVDGLHQRAGSRKVLELHGNILRTKCIDEGTLVAEGDETGAAPPRCPRCGGLLRPDVVWFGELLPSDVLDQAMQAAQTCDTFFSVGTSALVQPAAALPWLALDHGAVLVEVNIQETPLTCQATYALRGPSGVVLPELVRAVWGINSPSPNIDKLPGSDC